MSHSLLPHDRVGVKVSDKYVFWFMGGVDGFQDIWLIRKVYLLLVQSSQMTVCCWEYMEIVNTVTLVGSAFKTAILTIVRVHVLHKCQKFYEGLFTNS